MKGKEGYILVSWDQILSLLHRQCLTAGCDAMVPEETETSEQGAAVSFTMCCSSNHSNTWHSSGFYPKKSDKGKARSKLNVQLSTFILLCGLQFSNVEVFIISDFFIL